MASEKPGTSGGETAMALSPGGDEKHPSSPLKEFITHIICAVITILFFGPVGIGFGIPALVLSIMAVTRARTGDWKQANHYANISIRASFFGVVLGGLFLYFITLVISGKLPFPPAKHDNLTDIIISCVNGTCRDNSSSINATALSATLEPPTGVPVS